MYLLSEDARALRPLASQTTTISEDSLVSTTYSNDKVKGQAQGMF